MAKFFPIKYFSIIIEEMIIKGIADIILIKLNFNPKNEISKSVIGILRQAEALKKAIIILGEAFFLKRTAETGNAVFLSQFEYFELKKIR